MMHFILCGDDRFAVKKCNLYVIDTVVRDKLRYLFQSVCFQSGVGINFFNDADASLYHQKKIFVNVVCVRLSYTQCSMNLGKSNPQYIYSTRLLLMRWN